MAELLAIYLRPAARLPVRSVDRATAVADVGLDGDHTTSGKRQVTLLARDAWRTACNELGKQIDPSIRRANLLVDGLDLAASIGRTIRIGAVAIDIHGETRPCELLDDDGNVGLCAALRADRRAGVFGTVRDGGELHVGAACSFEPS